MWKYILLLLSIFNIIITDKKDRKISNPSICFSLLWTFVVSLASFRWLGLHKTNEEEYLLICLGVMAFLVGFHLASIFKNKKLVMVSGYDREYTPRYNILCAVTLICIIYYLPGFFKSMVSMLSGMSLNDVRGNIQGSEYSTGLSNFIPNFVILPISVALEPLAIVDYWFGERKKKFIYLVLALVLVRTLGDGGRTPVFNLVLYFVVANAILNQRRKKDNREEDKSEKEKNKRDKKVFKRVSVLGVLALTGLTFMRAANTVFRKLYFYFAMSPVLLSRWDEYIRSIGYRGHGLVSFNGIIYLFEYFRKNLTGTAYSHKIIEAYKLVAMTDSQWMKIAPTTTANAYVSCFWFFNADFGMAGVIILSLLYGLTLGYFYHRMKNNGNLCTLALFLLLYQGVFFSFIRFPFAKAYYIIAILFICFVAYKKTMRRELTWKN